MFCPIGANDHPRSIFQREDRAVIAAAARTAVVCRTKTLEKEMNAGTAFETNIPTENKMTLPWLGIICQATGCPRGFHSH